MISSSGILTIDLAAIQRNWCYVASLLKNTDVKPSQCAAVVKANAYGVGASEVASALYSAGCRYFYLATLEEAAQLRSLLPQDATLYVLGGIKEGAEPAFIELNLIPVLYSLVDIQRWLVFCAVSGSAFPCVIKIDTGMTRLGLSADELQQLLASIPSQPWLNPVLLLSHLACADEPDHPQNGVQLARFQAAIQEIKHFFPSIKASLANSSGTFLGVDYHFDMVRIGAALYGINPQPDQLNPLHAVISLKLPVLQVRTTEEAAWVGYGAEKSVQPATRLAVVAGGYADGIHRSLGMNPKGLVEGVLVSAVGRVSMDSMVFDISAVTSRPDYIDVINAELTLDVLMKDNKTLGYEVLTSLGRRYHRQYLPAIKPQLREADA